MSEKICPDCGHSLENNEHGFDQNDFEYDSETGKFIAEPEKYPVFSWVYEWLNILTF